MSCLEPEAAAKIFRVDSLISYFLPLLNYPNLEFSANVAKLLATVTKDSKSRSIRVGRTSI